MAHLALLTSLPSPSSGGYSFLLEESHVSWEKKTVVKYHFILINLEKLVTLPGFVQRKEPSHITGGIVAGYLVYHLPSLNKSKTCSPAFSFLDGSPGRAPILCPAGPETCVYKAVHRSIWTIAKKSRNRL